MSDELYLEVPKKTADIIEEDDEIYLKTKGRYKKFMDFYSFKINANNRLALRKLARKMKRSPDDSYFMGVVLSKCLDKFYEENEITLEKTKHKEMDFEITKLDLKRIMNFIKRDGIVNLILMLKLKEIDENEL